MSDAQGVVAHAPSGSWRGVRRDDGLLGFPGVRFGQAARFERPRPVPAHPECVDATPPGPICPQLGSRLDAAMGPQFGEPVQSEDCLYLSVTTPALAGSRPVMVWLHGGGFLTGGGTLPWYDGGRLAADGDVVVVSVNYRVGAFGYLVHDGSSEGNLGLWDQLLALEWVRDNAAAFGGDPSNVTVFGQSAGALSIHALLSMPESRRLIDRAIIQSMPSPSIIQSRDEARAVGAFFASQVPGDLATASTTDLLAAQGATLQWNAANTPGSTVPPFSIVLDSPLEDESTNSNVLHSGPRPEMLIGWTTAECVAFGFGVEDQDVLDALTQVSLDLIIEPSRDLAAHYAAAGGHVHAYEFAWAPEAGGQGAIHCLELPFLLGTEESWAGSPMLGAATWTEVERVGRSLRRVWTGFARSGEAQYPDGSAWPRWTSAAPAVAVIGLSADQS